MMINEQFDATQIAPQQGGGKHPVGNKWDFQVVNTSIQGTKDQSGGMYVVECASPAGSITMRYNLWNQSEQARKMAQGQLSALCHATGIFKLDFSNEGAALRGARFKGDVGFQVGHEPSAEKPEGGYVEMKKVYDVNGNEPGKSGNVAQQPQQNNNSGANWGSGQQQQPQNGQAAQSGNWNNNQPQQSQQPQNNSPSVQSGWNAGGQQQQPQGQAQQGGWQQNNNGPSNTAPWKQ